MRFGPRRHENSLKDSYETVLIEYTSTNHYDFVNTYEKIALIANQKHFQHFFNYMDNDNITSKNEMLTDERN